MDSKNATSISKGLEISTLAVQYCPVQGDIVASTEKVLSMINKYQGAAIDVVVLPECALTGYSFKDRQAMQHLAEVQGKGPQFEACRKIAKLLNSYVAMGYMERESEASGIKI